ncbi:MAG: Fe-S cluster assembly protein SufD [Gemmatimonadetes bacterium 13_2_20CM_69_8]|nr:MAG: Fe-S cluster assembly protein SufD [Gemmatimonadetes bacterium 13_2_20CM_69_8]OLD94908.1 MAG: Fe-S cluster assembly protein SufD [Gemmatimonadetes bacterium 13_1_20CM_4_69_16]PYO15571.1 MAG: Fe-S cluster assembly protein SufD [Gemmatimonadota bacterium]
MTEQYVADFKAFAGNGAGGAPAWLRKIREGAIARFAELGFPTTKQEEWRFTSVAPIKETRFALAHAAGAQPPSVAAIEPLLVCPPGSPRMVFVDGRYAPELSSVGGLPRGVHAGSLAVALTSGRNGELARQHLTRHARWHESAFAALNTAFLADGAFVHVAAHTILEQPLELLFVATGGRQPTVSHPRSLIVVERDAQAAVVEGYAALTDDVYWTNGVTEAVVGEGARVEYYRVQREGRRAYHVATTQSRQERDSFFGLHAVTLGGALARHDVLTALDGAGAELILNGLYVLRDSQHADHHTVIEHARPHCASHEFFNGVLDQRAHGVFNGRIIVRPGAQRTDSKQTNNNLLLSTDARADSQPQLEIYADDVKCTHGSTVGPIDQTALYYLRSRGLSPEMAQSLLTYGFAAEILGRMGRADVRDRLDPLVRAALA